MRGDLHEIDKKTNSIYQSGHSHCVKVKHSSEKKAIYIQMIKETFLYFFKPHGCRYLIFSTYKIFDSKFRLKQNGIYYYFRQNKQKINFCILKNINM